jgi:hypothetical protein
LTQLKVEDPSGYEHHLAGTVDPKLTEFQAQRPRRGTKKLKANKSAPSQKADKKEKKKTKKKSKAKR